MGARTATSNGQTEAPTLDPNDVYSLTSVMGVRIAAAAYVEGKQVIVEVKSGRNAGKYVSTLGGALKTERKDGIDWVIAAESSRNPYEG